MWFEAVTGNTEMSGAGIQGLNLCINHYKTSKLTIQKEFNLTIYPRVEAYVPFAIRPMEIIS